MAEINLLQQTRKSGINLPKPSFTGFLPIWILSGILVAELAAWGGIYVYRGSVESKNNDVQIQIQEVDRKISDKKKPLLPAVQAQGLLTSFKSLLDEHVHWTKIWEELGKVTLKTVTFSGLSATTADNKFFVDGTVGTYSELGKLLLGLAISDNFEEVALVSSQPSEGETVAIAFRISIVVKPELFLDNSEE